jgi:acyl-CoA synthetase (AMP-forming)/AMP-acid ligase II
MPITRVSLRTVQPLPEPPVTGMAEPVSTLDTLLRSVAARNPGATAVVAPSRVALDFAGLVGQVDEVRAALAVAGLGPTDRVAVSLPQGPEMAVAVLGVASALPCVPLDPRSRAEELAPYLAEVGARAVIVPRAGEHPARAAAHAAGLCVLTVDVPAGAPAGRFLLAAGASGVAPATPAHNGGTCAAPAAPRADAVALVLPTSGTTSRPKRVQLSHANLCASARSIAAALALGSADRALIAMPLFHIHGLLMWLATLSSGGSAACPPAFDPARFAAWLEELRPTWYSAVPTIHHAVVALAGLDRASAARVGLRFVRSSSAPLPPRLGAELEALFGAPVIEAYGMTEASHQIASNPLPPGERRPGAVGRPAGAEVSVVDEAGCPLPPGAQGEVAIRGAGVTAGYEGLPAARDAEGWLRTGDLGWLDADGYLHLAGRLKELVNRGGEKIAPGEVEEALGAHPAVAEAVVFPVPHPTLGEDVAAAVVLRPGAMVTAQDLRAHVRARLADHKVPGLVRLVERIPTGPTGKFQRPRLAELLALAIPHPRGAAEPPATPTELILAGIWSDVLGVEVGRNDDFFELGGHSLLALRVLARIHERLGVELDLRVVFDGPTVEALARAIDARRSAAAPADDLDPIVDALAGLGDEQVRRVIGARDDRSQG